MKKMQRRDFLALGSLALAHPIFALAGPTSVPSSRDSTPAEDMPGQAASTGAPLFLSAASDTEGGHWLRAFRLAREGAAQAYALRLPARAHHVAVHEAAGLFVVVARRPGNYLVVGDLASGRLLREISVPEDRHLFGHGVFSPDGGTFYAVESDYRDMKGDSGRLVAWRFERRGGALDVQRAADYPTHGVGPHELLLMPDGRTLVVANGGIRTHPDSGREILNLETMQPSLVYLDTADGRLLEQRRLAPEHHQASIRHLDVNAAGEVALVMQYEGLPFLDVPLVALHRRSEEIRFPEVPLMVQQQMKQYCGSVRFDESGRFFAVSCPRGSMITFWDSREDRFLDSVRSRDGCGLSALGGGFLFTAGSTGRIAWYDLESRAVHEFAWNSEQRLLWDNHLSMAGGRA